MCEDSASCELSVTEIGSAMSEISFLLDEIRNMDEEQPFGDSGGNPFYNSAKNDPNVETELGANMPATLEELKMLTSKNRFGRTYQLGSENLFLF